MSKINESIFQSFCLLSQKVQKIQQKVENENVTPEKRISLHKELETLHDSLEDLRNNALTTQNQVKSQFSHLDEMEKQIISLYRNIEERFEDYEMTLISKEAVHLGSSLAAGKMIKISNQVNELRHNIHFLLQHRKPSLKHRKIVDLALKLIDHAAEVSQNRTISKEQLRLVHLLKMLLEDTLMQTEITLNPEQAELAMELYEIADLLHHNRQNEGRLRLHLIHSKLTRSQQKRLELAKSPHEMVRILIEIAEGDACAEWEDACSSPRENVIHVLQA